MHKGSQPSSSQKAAHNPYSKAEHAKSLASHLAKNGQTIPSLLKWSAQFDTHQSHLHKWQHMELNEHQPTPVVCYSCFYVVSDLNLNCDLKSRTKLAATMTNETPPHHDAQEVLRPWWACVKPWFANWWTEDNGTVHTVTERCHIRRQQHVPGQHWASLCCWARASSGCHGQKLCQKHSRHSLQPQTPHRQHIMAFVPLCLSVIPMTHFCHLIKWSSMSGSSVVLFQSFMICVKIHV